jgi:hypothetical protein
MSLQGEVSVVPHRFLTGTNYIKCDMMLSLIGGTGYESEFLGRCG